MLLQSDLWETLAQDRDLTVTAFRVLIFMLNRMDFENDLQIRQAVIAEKLGVAQPNVSSAIKLLVNKGIIEIITREGYRYYRLNADYVWKGRAKSLHDHRSERREQRQSERTKRKFEVIEGGLSA